MGEIAITVVFQCHLWNFYHCTASLINICYTSSPKRFFRKIIIMDSHIVQTVKNTAVMTGILVCMFSPLFDEDHDWNAPLTEKPGSPHRYSNRTRSIKHVSVTYGRRNKRPREFIQNPVSFISSLDELKLFSQNLIFTL